MECVFVFCSVLFFIRTHAVWFNCLEISHLLDALQSLNNCTDQVKVNNPACSNRRHLLICMDKIFFAFVHLKWNWCFFVDLVWQLYLICWLSDILILMHWGCSYYVYTVLLIQMIYWRLTTVLNKNLGLRLLPIFFCENFLFLSCVTWRSIDFCKLILISCSLRGRWGEDRTSTRDSELTKLRYNTWHFITRPNWRYSLRIRSQFSM